MKAILVYLFVVGCGDPKGYNIVGNIDAYGGEDVVRYAIGGILEVYGKDESVLDGYTIEIFQAEKHPDIAGDTSRDFQSYFFGRIHTENENNRRVRISDDARHLCESALAHELAHVVVASYSSDPWCNQGHPPRYFAEGALVDQAQNHLCNEMGWDP
jgi:hypothetical protein